MGIFDIFRKKKEEQPKQTLSFDKLPSFIDEKIAQSENQAKQFKEELKILKDQFSLNLKDKISLLKRTNLDKRKEAEKLKEVVLENLSHYISHLEKLSEELDGLEDTEPKSYLKQLESIFNKFAKNSTIHFERANILIGKELQETKRIIIEFSVQINERIKANAENFEKLRSIGEIKKSLQELGDLRNVQKQIIDYLTNLKFQFQSLEKEEESLEKNYKNYLTSKEHQEFREEQEKLEKETRLLAETLLKLKQEIDFKSLLNLFHSNSKKTKLLQHYSENFREALIQDTNLELSNLAREAKLNIDETRLAEVRDNILNKIHPLENPKISEFKTKLDKISQTLNYEKTRLQQEEAKKIKFEEKSKKSTLEIKELAEKLWQNIIIEI